MSNPLYAEPFLQQFSELLIFVIIMVMFAPLADRVMEWWHERRRKHT
jgi:hypothetical protein